VPGWRFLLLPALILWAVLTALAVSLWLSALNVRYRDVTYVIPFFVQIWMFVSPVAYPSSLVPARWRPLYDLNPVLDCGRLPLVPLQGLPGPVGVSVLTSLAVVLALLARASCTSTAPRTPSRTSSDDDTVISVEGLGKRYRIGEREAYGTLRDSLARMANAARWVRRSDFVQIWPFLSPVAFPSYRSCP